MSNRKRPRGRPSKYPPEFQRDAVAMVLDEHRSIADVARSIGVNEGTLGNWVNVYRRQHPEEEQPLTLTISGRARLRELERENRELRMQAEFEKKAAAYFAQDAR